MSTSSSHPQPSTRELSARRQQALAKRGFSWDHWKFVPPEVVPCAITRTVGKRYAPAAVSSRAEKTIEGSDRLSAVEIPVNVLDLGLVIARKPPKS